MSAFIVLTILLGNAAWAIACLSLLLTSSQAQALLGWMGLMTGEQFIAFFPVYLLFALACQIVLFYLLSNMKAKNSRLLTRFRNEKSTNKELMKASEEKERSLKATSEALMKAGNVEEQMKAVEARADGLEQLTAELRLELTASLDRCDQLQAALARAEEQIKTYQAGLPKPWWKVW